MSTDAPTACVERPCSLAAAASRALAWVPISVADPQLDYCLALAHKNMSPYLERRGEQFNDARWRQLAPQAEFFLIVDTTNATGETVGFVSVRRDPECPSALHMGDVQIDVAHQNRGAGSAALQWIEDLARARGVSELTLNVFRDNPAIRLYQRSGFQLIDTQFYKYKMRKTLQP